jgi:xylulokinase
MYSLGIDVGSSSVKVSIFNIETGKSVSSAFYPEKELVIEAKNPGWAEQDPEVWWQSFLNAGKKVFNQSGIAPDKIKCIGISYQMHGLVLLDKDHNVVRPSIIWCDSRAVGIGDLAYDSLGDSYCTGRLCNSPGNFTASKLRWVKENEEELYDRVAKFMLPGDYIAFRLSGEINTTASGLSEGIFWDFEERRVSEELLSYYDIDKNIVPDEVTTFGEQSRVNAIAAEATGIKAGTPVTYRAGDQPNNAFSLNVLNPGEIAATAGTSGVIYAVTEKKVGDKESRVNTFMHVNDQPETPRNGVLLCINGTGILNSWLRRNIGSDDLDYESMNSQAANVSIGAEGLRFLPFGNGAERVLKNRQLNASLLNMDFNRHNKHHIFRAGQEGIVFALKYGFDLLEDLGVAGKTIRAGKANMFLSPVFREAFANTVGARVELYNTDGAEGAARGAAYGAGFYNSFDEAFKGLENLQSIDPDEKVAVQYHEFYQDWKAELLNRLNQLK